jgi:ribosomal protein L5
VKAFGVIVHEIEKQVRYDPVIGVNSLNILMTFHNNFTN